MTDKAMSEDDVTRAITLATKPQTGEKFTLGGKEFTFQFLPYDAEQELTTIVVALMKGVGQGVDYALMFATSTAQLPTMVGIITRQQDPSCDEAWLRKTPGITASQLIDVLVKQLQLNEVVDTLGKLLSIAGLAAAMSPRGTTSPTPSSPTP